MYSDTNTSLSSAVPVSLERPYIHKTLTDAIQKPLTLVVAGAGYGKTHAVSASLRKLQCVTIWVQLSELDNMRDRFWENFAASFVFCNKSLQEAMLNIGFPDTEQKNGCLTAIMGKSVHPDRKYVLVFDDFHLIRDQEILGYFHRFINVGFTAQFPNISVILLSRIEPAIDTIGQFSRGQVTTINEEQLRFSKEEMLAYFEAQGIELSTEMATELYRDTEGWIFAISLAHQFLKNSQGREHHMLAAMKTNVFNLLESEIYSAISAQMQRFLIRLSLVTDLPLELVRALSFGDETLVEGLQRLSSFIRYDSFSNVYRIHHLFLDFMAGKRGTLTEEETRAVYVAAAEWCRENNYMIDAMRYYAQADCYHDVIEIAYMFPQLIPRESALFILALLEPHIDSLCQQTPVIHGLYVRLLISVGRLEEALHFTHAAVDAYQALPPSKFNYRVLFSCYNHLGFLDMIMAPLNPAYRFGHYFERGDHFFTLGAPFGEYAPRGPVTSATTAPFVCRTGSGDAGAIQRYIDVLEETIPYAAHSMDGCMLGIHELAKAELAYYRGEFSQALHFAHMALLKARENRQYETANRALFYLMCCAVYAGNHAEVTRLVEQMEASLSNRADATRYATFDIAMGWLWLQLRQPERVAAWVKRDSQEGVVLPAMLRLEHLLKIRYHLTVKNDELLLAYLESQPIEGALVFVQISLLASKAVCLHRLGKREEAIGALERAYHLASPNELDMFFIELGNDMRSLASAAAKAEACTIPRAWLERLSVKINSSMKKILNLSGQQSGRREAQMARLTQRELDVLRNMSLGLTRQETAEDMFISINTVKTIIGSIYNKLGAVNRADAIRIAQSQGLL